MELKRYRYERESRLCRFLKAVSILLLIFIEEVFFSTGNILLDGLVYLVMVEISFLIIEKLCK